MNGFSLIFNSELTVEWINPDGGSYLPASVSEGKKLIDFFKEDRGFVGLIRWITQEEKEKFKCNLALKNNLKIDVVVIRSGTRFIIYEKKEKSKKGFTEIFWNVFSQTFPGGLLLISEELNTIEVSHKLLSMLDIKNRDGISLSKKAVLGKNIAQIFTASDEKEILSVIQKESVKAKKLRDVNIVELNFKAKDLRIIFGPVFDKNSYLGSCIYVFDISEEVERDRQIRENEALLFQSSKLAALGEMAGGIAHEINNPLAVLKGSIHVILKTIAKGKLTEESLLKDLTVMDTTVERIARIINGMRVISRDSVNENMERISPICILDDVLGISSERCKNMGVELVLDVESEVQSIQVECRRVQISQVILNLLNNAIDAVAKIDSPKLAISVSREQNLVLFRVSDNGEGVPSDIVNKIFQPFYTTKEVGKGTGLGLSLSRKIIEEHGHFLNLEQNDGETSFSFNLSIVHGGA